METNSKEQITFSFGQNWKNYLEEADEVSFLSAFNDINEWLGKDAVTGKKVLDLGCGSGIHSLAYHQLNAKELVSLDYDKNSVAATDILWKRAGSPQNWTVMQGSVLDTAFIKSLGVFDIVYSWGVLHHTGAMWNAIENCIKLVKQGGFCWISIYVKGPNYQRDLNRKIAYNKAGSLSKKWMEFKYFIFPFMAERLRARKNPFKWNERKERGMYVYYDIIDWLGGLPYEVASKEEIENFFIKNDFTLKKIKIYPEGSCNVYLFQKN
jgi:SAM-dependent methyltransferase